MEKYLEGELTIEEMKAGIRELVIKSQAYPVMCGSAFKNKGIQLMLNAVIDYLPSPLDVPADRRTTRSTTRTRSSPASRTRTNRSRHWRSRSPLTRSSDR